MSSNGKPHRKHPRTRSHVPMAQPGQDEPTPREGDGSASGPVEAVAGLLGAPVEPTVNDGPNRAPERGPGGLFAKGNKLAAGNPQAKRMAELRGQFLAAIHPGTIPALARKLQHDALKGDEFAVRVLFDYALGKPSQAVELSGPDGSPLGLNFNAVTAIVLDALAGDPARRIEVAARLMELDDVRDDDA